VTAREFVEPSGTAAELAGVALIAGGLEVLVAADIVRTVAFTPTLDSVFVLALIVAIRTFLSWSLALELDGRWPWQRTLNPSPS
jgi:uncharacterized membrane protein